MLTATKHKPNEAAPDDAAPDNAASREAVRLEALESYDILDTPADQAFDRIPESRATSSACRFRR
jgi:hypothetical protein